MARFFRRGVSKLKFLPAWAGTNPTAPELTAGTSLDAALADISGFEFANTPIPTPDLGTTFTSTIPGEDTTQNPTITFYDDDAGSAIRTAIPKGTAGFLAFMPYGQVATKRVEKWPIKVTGINDAWTAANEAAKFVAGFAVTAAPTQTAVLP